MLIPPVLSSRLPTGTFFPCAHEGRGRSIAGNPVTPPATAAVRRKSRRLSCLAIASPLFARVNVSGACGEGGDLQATVPPPAFAGRRVGPTSPGAPGGR